MNQNSAIRRWLCTSACIYTVAVLLLCVVSLLFSAEDMVLNPLSFLLLYPFSVCFAGANHILRAEKFSSGIRLLLHFLILSAGAVVFVFLPAGVFSSGRSALVIVCIYLLLYVLLMLAASLIRSAIRRYRAD